MRLEDDKDCLVFGDIDHCPDEDTANNIFQMIRKEFKVNVNQLSKSLSYKEDVKEYSYHWTIPSLKSNFKTLKHIFNQEKYTVKNLKIWLIQVRIKMDGSVFPIKQRKKKN